MGGTAPKQGPRGLDRRALLAAAGGVALLHVTGCGKETPTPPAPPSGDRILVKKGKPQRPNRPIAERPPGAKTTKRKHAAPQTSARHSKAPLPPELQGYLAAKGKDGTLVPGRRSNVLHHPVVCKKHLAPAAPRSAPTPTAAAPKVHQRYADAILYALVRSETDANVALGVALVAAVTWPVSARFTDWALAALAASGKPRDVGTLTAALAAVGSPSPRDRAEQALRVLEERANRAHGR